MASEKQAQDWDEVVAEKKYGRPTSRVQEWDEVDEVAGVDDAAPAATADPAPAAPGAKPGLMDRVLGSLLPRRKR